MKTAKNCPTNNPKVTWYDYINSNVAPISPAAGNMFGVEFRFAKELGDADAYGNISTDACYLVMNVTHPKNGYKKGFYALRTFERSRKKTADQMHGLPGNAKDWEINVYGTIFLFNNNGEVIDRRGRTVGLLVCYTSNECGKY